MEQANSKSRTDRIRKLNDAHRAMIPTTTVFLSRGIAELDREAKHAIIEAVRTFSTFTKGNDPWGEHDFGAFKIESNSVFWKIDYYDLEGVHGSADPADPAVTRRVLTILLSDEY